MVSGVEHTKGKLKQLQDGVYLLVDYNSADSTASLTLHSQDNSTTCLQLLPNLTTIDLQNHTSRSCFSLPFVCSTPETTTAESLSS